MWTFHVAVEHERSHQPWLIFISAGNLAFAARAALGGIAAFAPESCWITGFFEETRLHHVRAGAAARAALMGYSDMELLAHV